MARCDCLHLDHHGRFCATEAVGSFSTPINVTPDSWRVYIYDQRHINLCFACRAHMSADQFRALQHQTKIVTTQWSWRYYDPIEGELMEWRARHA